MKWMMLVLAVVFLSGCDFFGTAFCTEDAKECWDGSFVSRDPNNNCEFRPCPEEPLVDCIEDGEICRDISLDSCDRCCSGQYSDCGNYSCPPDAYCNFVRVYCCG